MSFGPRERLLHLLGGFMLTQALATAARLVIVEFVLEPGDEPDWGKLIDLHMLVMVGGRERSEEEWRGLLADAGFELLPRERASGRLEAVTTIARRSPEKGLADGV